VRRFAVLALPFLVIACGGQSAAPPAATSAAPYAVERLKPAGSPLESRFVGQVEGLEETVITARTGGTVEALLHDVGDRVAAGTVVVRLRSAEQRSGAAQAEAAVRAAAAAATESATRRARLADMHARQVVPKSVLDAAVANDEAAQARLAAAQAAREAAREGLAYTTAAVPYAAVITSRTVRLGQVVVPGMPLFGVLGASGRLRVVVDLPGALAATLRDPATTATLYLPSGPLRIRPTTLAPAIDSESGTTRARFDLPADTPGLVSGMHASVGLGAAGEGQVITVPAAALVERDEVTAVYVWDAANGRTRLRQVRPGATTPDGRIAILGGLRAGDEVAIDAAAALRQLQQARRAGVAR